MDRVKSAPDGETPDDERRADVQLGESNKETEQTTRCVKKFNVKHNRDGAVVLGVKRRVDEDEVIVPDVVANRKVNELKRRAFGNYEGLKKITLPAGMRVIGEAAFIGCKGLTEIVVPPRVKVVPKDAFCACGALKDVVFPENSELTTIGERAFFGCAALTELKLPDGVEVIDERAFEMCRNLKSVALGPNVKRIAPRAFANCRALEEINLPDSLEEIGADAFAECGSLKIIGSPKLEAAARAAGADGGR